VVRCPDAKSVEQTSGIERVFGRKCECCGCRVRGICFGDRDVGIDLFAIHSVWVFRVETYIRICAENRSDGIELDDG